MYKPGDRPADSTKTEVAEDNVTTTEQQTAASF